MRISTRLPGLLAALLWIPALSGEESILTEALPLAEINASPYRYNGLMYVRGALGSAVMVGAGVYATAAHVIFDEEAQTVTWRRVFYDVETTVASMLALGMPDFAAARLSRGL